MGIAVQFGAGSIGRGFLGQLYFEAGLEIVFVDILPDLVDLLNCPGGYRIRIVGNGARDIRVAPVRALLATDLPAIADALAQADMVATAVGAASLPDVAPVLAEGLVKRFHAGGKPLNVLTCENLRSASAVLHRHVLQSLPAGVPVDALAQVRFVHTVISRMVPPCPVQEHGTDVRAEDCNRLAVNGAAVVGPLPDIPGMEIVDNFEAHVERKLYTHNCAHAVLGCCGYHAGFQFAADALADPRIAALVRAVMSETGAALVRRYGFGSAEQAVHEADLLARFANRELGDTCARLARDPIRKLAPDDRLVGAARLCEAEGITPHAVAWGIASALMYRNEADPESLCLAQMLSDLGLETTLRRVCGIEPDESLGELVGESVRLMERGSLWR